MNKIFFLISFFAVLLFSCTAKNSESSSTESAAKSDLIVNPDALIQIDVNVVGMTCTGCESTINTGVGEIQGVVEVESSFVDGKTVVTFDSTQTNIDKISQAIIGKGYTVKDWNLHVTEEGIDSTVLVKP